MAIIIGVDPGLNNTGWGVVSYIGNNLSYIDCGRVVTNVKDPLNFRLHKINDELNYVINKYKPDHCAIEETFVNQNPKSSLKLGHARGAILLTMSIANILVYEYAARFIKKSIVGTGSADKKQVMSMVKVFLPKASINSEDASDALATAICHTHYNKFNEALKRNV